MRIFLDANILFSAVLPGSRTMLFIATLHKQSELVTSQAAVDEAARNLARKFSAHLPNLQHLVQTITVTCRVASLRDVELVEKDRHILGAAVAAQCSHLLTGDERHFRHLFGKNLGGVKVVHTALLAKEIGLNRIVIPKGK